jgi:hypothetical protein
MTSRRWGIVDQSMLDGDGECWVASAAGGVFPVGEHCIMMEWPRENRATVKRAYYHLSR